MDKKIMILVPIWGRRKITEICLENLSRLKEKGYNIDVLCIVSENWAKLLAFKMGFRQVYASNDDLGEKMNIGINFALKYDFDYLMNLGSDDIVKEEMFEIYEPFLKSNTPIFGISKVLFYDVDTKRAKECNYQTLIGAGRCIRKDLIREKLDFCELYDKGISRGLDLNSIDKFSDIDKVEIEAPLIIDLKSKENIWTYDKIGGVELDTDTIFKGVDSEILDKIIEL